MPAIKQYYKQLYGKEMAAQIKSDVSGDFGKLIVGLVNKSLK